MAIANKSLEKATFNVMLEVGQRKGWMTQLKQRQQSPRQSEDIQLKDAAEAKGKGGKNHTVPRDAERSFTNRPIGSNPQPDTKNSYRYSVLGNCYDLYYECGKRLWLS